MPGPWLVSWKISSRFGKWKPQHHRPDAGALGENAGNLGTRDAKIYTRRRRFAINFSTDRGSLSHPPPAGRGGSPVKGFLRQQVREPGVLLRARAQGGRGFERLLEVAARLGGPSRAGIQDRQVQSRLSVLGLRGAALFEPGARLVTFGRPGTGWPSAPEWRNSPGPAALRRLAQVARGVLIRPAPCSAKASRASRRGSRGSSSTAWARAFTASSGLPLRPSAEPRFAQVSARRGWSRIASCHCAAASSCRPARPSASASADRASGWSGSSAHRLLPAARPRARTSPRPSSATPERCSAKRLPGSLREHRVEAGRGRRRGSPRRRSASPSVRSVAQLRRRPWGRAGPRPEARRPRRRAADVAERAQARQRLGVRDGRGGGARAARPPARAAAAAPPRASGCRGDDGRAPRRDRRRRSYSSGRGASISLKPRWRIARSGDQP